MTLRTVGRRTSAMLAVGGVAVSLLGVAASPAPASSSGMLFDGGGRGPTAEIAIRRAIGDAAVSASAYQLYTCTQVGEAQVFETLNDPNFGHVFRAQVTVFCTP
jgi:ribosomal protein S12 methylthiotransferase accessory factor YcaO